MKVSNPARPGEELIKTVCNSCINLCGLNVYVKGGEIIRVEGDPEHAVSKGYLCPRGQALIDWEYSPDRLKYPMKRVNGDWKRISWDEALDIVATKLQEVKEHHGARSLAFMPGALDDLSVVAYAERFRTIYGTPNYFSPDTCYFDILRAHRLTLGDLFTAEPEGSSCIIVWGANLDGAWPNLLRRTHEAVSAGAKLIVINPKRTPLAKEGIHISVRPGTDGALALAMLNVIISENLYDKEFVKEWTVGFDKLREHVKQYSPEKVAVITWVPAEDIRIISRMFATSKPACILQSIRALGQTRMGIETSRLICMLHAVTGNIEKHGSWTRHRVPTLTNLRFPIQEKPIGTDAHPLFYEVWDTRYGTGMLTSLADVLLSQKPYPIKAVIAQGGDALVGHPDGNKTAEALKKLEFLVFIGLFMNNTAKLANIVLPAANFLEKTAPIVLYVRTQGLPYIALRNQVVEPPAECLSEYQIWRRLATRMGFGEYFPWQTDEEATKHLLQKCEVSYEDLRKNASGTFYAPIQYDTYKELGFATPSGKIEFYSKTMEEFGYDPLPVYHEPTQSPMSTPDLVKQYPLILVTGERQLEYSHSQFHNIDQVSNLAPEALAEVHPDTASGLDLRDGDMVAVETPKGSIEIRLKVTEDMALGVVSVPHGWQDASANDLTDLSLCEPILGQPQLNAILCSLKYV